MKKSLFVIFAIILGISVSAAPLRRQISPEQPMWIIHIDTWNNADPERIIEMVPEDIRPFVCFNLSLSATDATCCSGPDVCDSWMRACASARVWTMIQPASGSHCRFSDKEWGEYERYFKEYPNFIGWNFAEQFWGFGDAGQPTFPERLNTFVHILDYCQEYGGYLVVSFTQAYFSADMMPIAYMHRNKELRQRLTEHPENFICCEKYTMANDFFDIESNCVGAYLGGYAGQLGIRFDACGWSASNSDKYPFVKASGAIPIMEHVLLDGETVIDGPETIPVECSHEVKTSLTDDGYTRRNWEWYPHFENINIDEFRKILDGTVRIMSREELIDRSKVVIINDGASNYHTPENLYDGVCRQECDNFGRGLDKPHKRPLEQRWWLKSSGRYPCIPQTYALLDDEAQEVENPIKWSDYQSIYGYNDATDTQDKIDMRLQAKIDMLNSYFPEEYTGDIYASHHENTWMTYNPYQYDETYDIASDTRTLTWATKRSEGVIPFQYNTCDSVRLKYAPYSMGIMKEYKDKVSFYLTNYRNSVSNGKFTEASREADTIYIYGIKDEPVVEWKDRGDHVKSAVKRKFADGVLMIRVLHNGPVDLTISCSGTATDRLTEYTKANIVIPELPPVYNDTLQYEAECFDYKSIAANRTNGYYHGHTGYKGQGFVEVGKNLSAALRDTISLPATGKAKLKVRYQSPEGDETIKLSLNEVETSILLPRCDDWREIEVAIDVIAGINVAVLSRVTSSNNIFLDCIKVYDYPIDDSNSIKSTESDLPACRINGAYNLKGQKVDDDAKGLLIIDGKKIYKQ